MAATGLVSVVIPTRDRRELLARAIASCEESARGGPDVEVIVVDDGSQDGTAEALRNLPGVRYLRHETSLGRCRARDSGLAAARGELVKFLDDDDFLASGALAEEAELARNRCADIVAGGWRTAGAGVPERTFMPPDFADGVDSLLRGAAVPTGAALYRKSALTGVAWEESCGKLDDWDFFLHAALAARRIERLPRVVYTWFGHAGQGIHRDSMLDNARAFYRVLDRLEVALGHRNLLTEARRRRLAQYRYKELRVLCRYHRSAFELEVERIQSLDPEFFPRDEELRGVMRLLSRLVGFRTANLIWFTAGRLVGRF